MEVSTVPLGRRNGTPSLVSDRSRRSSHRGLGGVLDVGRVPLGEERDNAALVLDLNGLRVGEDIECRLVSRHSADSR